MAPAQAGAQVVTQGQIGGRQAARSQYTQRETGGVDEPVEGGLLLLGVEQVHIVHQHGGPVLVKRRRVLHAGIEPAHGGALIAQGLLHGAEQMGFAAGAVAPQVGGHGGA